MAWYSVLLVFVVIETKSFAQDAPIFRYEVYPACETWRDAMNICISKGGTLAKISNNETQNNIVYLIKERHQLDHIDFWFDAHDVGEEGHWRTDDGEMLGYFNWAEGQPNNGAGNRRCGGNQHCAQLSQQRNFQWDDKECYDMKGYICQFYKDDRRDTHQSSLITKFPNPFNTNGGAISYNLPGAAAQMQSSSETTMSKTIDTAERVVIVVLALSFVNLSVLVAMVVFFYLVVWRKMQSVIVQEPVYKDLVNQNTTT